MFFVVFDLWCDWHGGHVGYAVRTFLCLVERGYGTHSVPCFL